MKKTTNKDVVNDFITFQQEVLQNKPSLQQMYADVQMMKFKIRPVTGDIATLDFENRQFIEALWSLGKLDDFFHSHIKAVKKTEQKVFFNLFDTIYQKYQDQLNKINILKNDDLTLSPDGFEMEIFREKRRSAN